MRHQRTLLSRWEAYSLSWTVRNPRGGLGAEADGAGAGAEYGGIHAVAALGAQPGTVHEICHANSAAASRLLLPPLRPASPGVACSSIALLIESQSSVSRSDRISHDYSGVGERAKAYFSLGRALDNQVYQRVLIHN